MNAGTGVGLPAQHFELHVAFVGHGAVQRRSNIGDVLSLRVNVSGRSEKHGHDAGVHRSSEYCIAGNVWPERGSDCLQDAHRVASAVYVSNAIRSGKNG